MGRMRRACMPCGRGTGSLHGFAVIVRPLPGGTVPGISGSDVGVAEPGCLLDDDSGGLPMSGSKSHRLR